MPMVLLARDDWDRERGLLTDEDEQKPNHRRKTDEKRAHQFRGKQFHIMR